MCIYIYIYIDCLKGQLQETPIGTSKIMVSFMFPLKAMH